MINIKIKPLSVNKAWKGRKFKTKEYNYYILELKNKLPNIKIPDGKLHLIIEFGFSSKASDVDNPLKPFIDVLQKRYGFDDKMIYKLDVKKEIVKKGEEFIKFKITKL